MSAGGSRPTLESSSRHPAAGTGAVAACLLVSLAAAAWGVFATDVLGRGLFASWDRASVWRFLIFAALAAAALGAGARTRAPRATWAGLAAVWLCLLFGMAAVAAAAGLFIAALGLGSVVAAPAALRERFGRAAGALLSLVAGLAVMQAVLQVLVHFAINTPQLYGVLAAAAAASGRSWLLADARTLAAYLRAPVERKAALAGDALLLGLLSVHTVHAALPERMFDALAVHLAVPTYVASHQQWIFDPSLYNWAVTPMGADWLFTAGYLLGGEAGTRLFNFGLQAAVVALLYLELSTRLSPPRAKVLAALYTATPLAFLQSASLYVENTLSLMLLAATVLLSRSWRNHRARDGVLLGLYLGAALATKLLAVFAALALVPLAVYSLARSLERRRLVASLGAAALVVLATGGVPYAYAWVTSGNPVLPYLNNVFRSPFLPPYHVTDARWTGHLRPGFLFQATFDSARFGELLPGSFGFQHLLLLPAGVLAVALLRRQGPWVAVLVGLVYCGGVVAIMQYLRYLYPAFPQLMQAEAEGLRRVDLHRRGGAAAMALALGALLANLAFMPTSGWVVVGFHTEALFSAGARERLLDETVPQRRLLRVASVLDGKSARVLELADPMAVDLEGLAIHTHVYNLTAQWRLFGARTEEDVARLVEDYQVNYVLRDQRLQHPPAVMSYLATQARPIRELGPYRLYRVRSR